MYKLHSGYEIYSVFCNDLDLCLTFDLDTKMLGHACQVVMIIVYGKLHQNPFIHV